jgi:hypothetical protein
MNFNTEKTIEVLNNLSDGHVHYAIGKGLGKVPNLIGTLPGDVRLLDCSGFAQYVIYKTTELNLRIPQGSKRQEDWLIDNGYTKIDYSTEACKMDNHVRIAFRKKTPQKKTRHVWLVINGKTYESTKKDGRNGPTSFHWFERENVADSCYFLGLIPGFLISNALYGL